MIYDSLVSKQAKIAVIGQGYVGLPIALAFAKKVPVIGFDISKKKIELLKQGIDPGKEMGPEDFKGSEIVFTDSEKDLKQANFFIVAVPTPVACDTRFQQPPSEVMAFRS